MSGGAGNAAAAFADLVAAIGLDGALELARKLGGIKVYIPTKLPRSSKLQAKIGDELLAKLIAFGGGSHITVPKRPERYFRVWKLHQEGALTRSEIAAETGFSERQVYRILKMPEAAMPGAGRSAVSDAQLDLFMEK